VESGDYLTVGATAQTLLSADRKASRMMPVSTGANVHVPIALVLIQMSSMSPCVIRAPDR
jgi:hypothetical protein